MNTTSSSDIRARVQGFVSENFYVPATAKLGDDTSLVESGIVDSTGILEILAFLERDLEIHVEDAEIVPSNLDSIRNIVAFVGKKRQGPAMVT